MPVATFLDGSTPGRLRGLVWLSLSETGYLLEAVSTSDSGGGVTQVWGTVGTADCRIDPIGTRGDTGVTAGRIDERTTHIVTVPAGEPVTTDHRFAINNRGTFEITAIRDRTAEWARMIEVAAV